MSHLLDFLLVGAALVGSILYALLALGPRAWRARLSSVLASLGLARIAPKPSGSCGGCDNCAAPDAEKSAAGTETRIAPQDIGRRRPEL
jgi:hypothetical protein